MESRVLLAAHAYVPQQVGCASWTKMASGKSSTKYPLRPSFSPPMALYSSLPYITFLFAPFCEISENWNGARSLNHTSIVQFPLTFWTLSSQCGYMGHVAIRQILGSVAGGWGKVKGEGSLCTCFSALSLKSQCLSEKEACRRQSGLSNWQWGSTRNA